MSLLDLKLQIFSCHWGHLAMIFAWVSGNLFHLAWNGNYEVWLRNPLGLLPVAHGIWDPHGSPAMGLAFSWLLISYSGLYHWLYTLGFWKVSQISLLVLGCQAAALASALLGRLHLFLHEDLVQWSLSLGASFGPWRPFWLLRPFENGGLRFSFHSAALFGFTSLAWAGHFLAVYAIGLGFLGGLKASTASLYLKDLAHHHLALGVLLAWAGHLLSSLSRAFAQKIWLGSQLAAFKSLELQLALSLAGLSFMAAMAAEQIYSLAPYFSFSYDDLRSLALSLHHSWIASFLMMGSFAQSAIFLIRDFSWNLGWVSKILAEKGSLLSSLSWVSLWLGFHSLGLYMHNDTVLALGQPQKEIFIEPIFAEFLESASGKAIYGLGLLGQARPGLLDASFLPLGPGDFLAHHAIALGLQCTTLVLLKGSLDSRGSRLMPEKLDLGYGFACDGPGRGGTCDVSAWDAFYLASFWMLNTNAWLLFYFHWKQLGFWLASQSSLFQESSTSLNGWFRDYFWFNSGALIHGYSAAGSKDLAVWAWLFLGAHLTWATGFMFLISWRGYWQELLEILLYMHLKTAFFYDLWAGFLSPVALSILQARFLGLVHFGAGFILTYAAFIIGATS